MNPKTQQMLVKAGDATLKTGAPKPEPQKEQKPEPKPNPRYEGSVAQNIEKALMKGVTYEEISMACGEPIGKVKACLQAGVKSGRWKPEERDDQVRMVRVSL